MVGLEGLYSFPLGWDADDNKLEQVPQFPLAGQVGIYYLLPYLEEQPVHVGS